MRKNHRGINKCDWCGKFVSWADSKSVFTPDTEFTAEKMAFYHPECLTEAKERVIHMTKEALTILDKSVIV